MDKTFQFEDCEVWMVELEVRGRLYPTIFVHCEAVDDFRGGWAIENGTITDRHWGDPGKTFGKRLFRERPGLEEFLKRLVKLQSFE